MSVLLVIFGINGRQGTAVAHTFLNTPGWQVRGLTSSPHSQASDNWRARGVDIVEVDVNKEDCVKEAVVGATAIFVVTDFYTQLADHSVQTLASLTSTPPERHASNRDFQAGQNILRAAANLPGLYRIVISTLETTPATVRGQWQVDGKKKLVRELQDVFPQLLPRTSYVQPCLPMEDFATLLKKVVKLSWIPDNH